MSRLCIFNFKEEKLNFKEFDNLAVELIKKSLKNQIAVFFNSRDYGENLIKEAGMKKYCLFSDSFLYKNCEFLDTSSCDILSFESFAKKFSFLKDIIKKIFDYKVSLLEVFMTENITNNPNDFKCLNTTPDNFLYDLHRAILSLSKEYAYGFPTVKFIINNPNIHTKW